MAREVIGSMTCPECGGDAEVKITKAGLGYRWCTECNAQYFPRTAEASDRLIAKCNGTKPAPEPVPEPAPVKAQEPEPAKPKAKAPPAPAKADPASAPKPVKPRSAFDDALAFLGGRA